MSFLYQIGIQISTLVLKVAAVFSKKISRFQQGRVGLFQELQQKLDPNSHYIWIHAASLGEYEQGLPVLEKLKEDFVNYRILLTFFSPSGFEVKKDNAPADLVFYLPLDTPRNARRFLQLVRPSLAIFVKYEIWPNFFHKMHEMQIPVVMISARFRKKQIFFKWYGGYMRKTLNVVHHFYVQDETSATLLASIGIGQVTVSGDTRFDRVKAIARQDNNLLFMQHFMQGRFCFVAGSTWPQDEDILVKYINQAPDSLKVVVVPHDIEEESCDDLSQRIRKRSVRLTRMKLEEIHECQVLIVDKVGLLTRIYSYADAAYVGGGFITGLHNTLEPAVFGIPVIIGPKYKGFREATDLVQLGGMFSIRSYSEFYTIMEACRTDGETRQKAGRICAAYVQKNTGASIRIVEGIRTLL